jgi:hypothetical protein
MACSKRETKCSWESWQALGMSPGSIRRHCHKPHSSMIISRPTTRATQSRVSNGTSGSGTQQPLFPRYLFVAFDIHHRERWPRINCTVGTDKLLPKHCYTPKALPTGAPTIEDLTAAPAPGF